MRHYLAAVQIFLYRQQYLVGIHRLDQVIGDVVAHGLIHDVFLLALGDHYHGSLRRYLLDPLQSFEAGKAGHILVENHEVEVARGHQFERVAPVVDRHGVIPLCAEEKYVGLQEVYLVIGP